MSLGGERSHTQTALQLPITDGLTKCGTDQGAHEFHAKLMGSELGVRVRRQRETAPPVWSERLLQQLRIQTARECHLHGNSMHVSRRSQCGQRHFKFFHA